MAALPQTGDATLPLRQLALSTLLCTCGNRTPCYASYSFSTSFISAILEVIPIAIYHCNISIVSRGKGKSAVAAAAYRSGEKLTNEWDGITHDYTRKGGVVHTEIMLPPHAPPSFSDRSTLWNSVELYEKAGNAQLAREIDAALPIELSREEQIRLVREYCSSQFVSKGMCVDFAIHDTDSGNPHCHIMLTMRPLDERGAWAAKSKKEYDLDENGERIRLPNGRYKTHKVDLTGWNDNRISEPMYASVDEIMPDLLEAVGEIVKEKFILFGHSMGAKIAYELEKRLEQSGIYARHLIVSGSRPPHIPEPNPICNLPKREFIRELTRFAGTPKEILGNEEMMNFFIPLLRADFEMDEKYLRKNKVKLECSINAFCGENDTEATETDMQEWGEYTSDFALEVFAGDHFFIKSNAKTVQSLNEIIKRNI